METLMKRQRRLYQIERCTRFHWNHFQENGVGVWLSGGWLGGGGGQCVFSGVFKSLLSAAVCGLRVVAAPAGELPAWACSSNKRRGRRRGGSHRTEGIADSSRSGFSNSWLLHPADNERGRRVKPPLLTCPCRYEDQLLDVCLEILPEPPLTEPAKLKGIKLRPSDLLLVHLYTL